jgi:arylsulfatase A-like enzyme
MISFLDDQVGIIMKLVKDAGLDNNTIIMFSSDNGATFSAGVDTEFFNSVGGLRGLKMDVYEGGIRVPFIARWPGKIAAHSVSDLPAVQYDLFPTLAELTGKEVAGLDGISFLPTLMGKSSKQKPHEFMYFEYPENGGQVAIRMGKWKGVRHNVRKNPDSPWELFNIDTDRNETKDLSTQHPEIVQAIKGIAKREHIHPHVMDWEFIDPKIKK